VHVFHVTCIRSFYVSAKCHNSIMHNKKIEITKLTTKCENSDMAQFNYFINSPPFNVAPIFNGVGGHESLPRNSSGECLPVVGDISEPPLSHDTDSTASIALAPCPSSFSRNQNNVTAQA